MLRHWRRYFVVLLCLTILSVGVPARAAERTMSLLLDGRPLQMDVPPIIQGGRTLVPLRAIMEALGAHVTWEPETRTAMVLHEGHTVSLPAGKGIALVDGKAVPLDVPAQIISERLLVPLRFLVEATGGIVDWLPEQNTVVMAVQDERLKGQLRVVKANRDIPARPPRYEQAGIDAGITLTEPTQERQAVDGVVKLSGRAGAALEGKFIPVWVSGPGGFQRETTLPVRQGAFAGEIHLADGPGWYSINLMVPADGQSDGLFMAVSLSVQNVATRPWQAAFFARAYYELGVKLDVPTQGQIAVNTALPIRGTAPTHLNGRYVWIEASKDGAKWHSYVPIREGKFDGAAHLGGGPGLYWAKVMVQTEVGANWYKTVAEVPVINTNSKTVLQPSVIQPEGQEAGLRLDPVTAEVPDGLLSLSGQVDPKRNIKSLWLKAKLGNQQDDIHLPVTEGRFNGKVPLALGAGDYEIAVLIPGGGSTWVVVGSLHVANQGTQVVRGFHYTAQAIARKVELTSPQTDPVEAQSRLTVAGTVGTSLGDFPYLIAETRFKGLEARYRLPVKMGRFEDDIRLRFGSGTYTVVLYAQVAQHPTGRNRPLHGHNEDCPGPARTAPLARHRV